VDLDRIQGNDCRLAIGLSFKTPTGDRGRGRLIPKDTCRSAGGRLVVSSTVTSNCRGRGVPGSDSVGMGEYEGLAISSFTGEGESSYFGVSTTSCSEGGRQT